MKALTVRQPHAQLIVMGVKTIETRSWKTDFRGPLVIHAGATPPKTQDIGPWHVWNESGHVWWLDGREGDPESDNYFELPLGAIVGTCNLVDVVPILEGTDELAIEEPRPCVVPYRSYRRKRFELSLWRGNDPEGESIDDQLPYGDFTPGRYAWLLEDAKPTGERCPACWGEGGHGRTLMGTATYRFDPCPICKGKGTCEPIPAKGKQGLWEWTP